MVLDFKEARRFSYGSYPVFVQYSLSSRASSSESEAMLFKDFARNNASLASRINGILRSALFLRIL